MTLDPEVAGDRRSAHFLSLLTWAREDFERVWERARAHHGSAVHRLLSGEKSPLAGGRVALRWERVSVHTRDDFVRGIERSGASPDEVLDADDSLTPEETASAWRGARGAVFRPASPARLITVTRSSPVPLVNAGTSSAHPFRVLADLLGLTTLGVQPNELTVAWLGRPGPELSSWLEAVVRFGVRLLVLTPEGAEVDESLRSYVTVRAGDRLRLGVPPEALAEAQVVIAGGDPVFVEEHGMSITTKARVFHPDQPRPWNEQLEAALAQALLEDLWERGVAAGRVRE